MSSSRLPTPTQIPSATDRTAGRYSVTTRRPPGRTVRRTVESAGGEDGCVVVIYDRLVARGPGTVPRPARSAITVTAIAVARGTVAAPFGGLAAAEVLAGGFPLDHLDRDERQLAAVVHLADLDLD